jgi:hypothetical protein
MFGRKQQETKAEYSPRDFDRELSAVVDRAVKEGVALWLIEESLENACERIRFKFAQRPVL